MDTVMCLWSVILLPVVLALLAVVLQVGDVMVVSVGVVAAPFTPDQPFDVTCRCLPAALGLPARRCLGLGCFRLLGLGLAPPLHPVHHHHLADAVSAEMFDKLLLVLSLEVTRFTVEGFLLLGALRRGDDGAVFAFGALLRCFGAGRGARLSTTGQVFSFVPIVLFLLHVVSHDHGDDARAWRLWVLDDTDLSVVLVVVAVPDQTHI